MSKYPEEFLQPLEFSQVHYEAKNCGVALSPWKSDLAELLTIPGEHWSYVLTRAARDAEVGLIDFMVREDMAPCSKPEVELVLHATQLALPLEAGGLQELPDPARRGLTVMRTPPLSISGGLPWQYN